MTQYGRTEYWEDRYQKDNKQFDWYQRYAQLQTIFNEYIPKDAKILDVGCGSSRLAEEMHDDDYVDFTNIDISYTVIKQMQEKYQERTLDGMTVVIPS